MGRLALDMPGPKPCTPAGIEAILTHYEIPVAGRNVVVVGRVPLHTFVPFLQNHDQVGNRAMGERITALASPQAVRLASAALLLAPSIPLLFMGEEFGARTPFLYFCDFAGDLARAVREGRRKEFAAFERFADPKVREGIPDPGAEKTFLDSKLPWDTITEVHSLTWLDHYKALLALRAREIAPRIAKGATGTFETVGETGVAVDWTLGDGSRLHLRANFGEAPVAYERPPGNLLHLEGEPPGGTSLGAWTGAWTLEAA
jgi:maltooligosyltrehalose trehalohydrolase